jgi:hypothetical protein
LRGVELPINVIVIIILAVLVLLAILALFMGVWTPGESSITLEAAKNNACQMLVSMRCNQPLESISVLDFDADKDGTLNGAGDTLLALCQNWYHVDENICKNQVCMCAGGGGGATFSCSVDDDCCGGPFGGGPCRGVNGYCQPATHTCTCGGPSGVACPP